MGFKPPQFWLAQLAVGERVNVRLEAAMLCEQGTEYSHNHLVCPS
jgi:hypothetical protein